MRMSVQKNIDIGRRLIGRNVLKTEFQSAAHKIDDQRPLEIVVAITAHERHAGSDFSELVENRFGTHISKMPDFICASGEFLHPLRQAIVRVRQDENPERLFRFFLHRHFALLIFELPKARNKMDISEFASQGHVVRLNNWLKESRRISAADFDPSALKRYAEYPENLATS